MAQTIIVVRTCRQERWTKVDFISFLWHSDFRGLYHLYMYMYQLGDLP